MKLHANKNFKHDITQKLLVRLKPESVYALET